MAYRPAATSRPTSAPGAVPGINPCSWRPERRATSLGTAPSEPLQLHQLFVGLRPPIAEELPHRANLVDHVEIHFGHHQSVLILTRLREEIAARVHEVGRAVELADVPRRLGADPVDAAHEVAVGDRVRRLLELPEIL